MKQKWPIVLTVAAALIMGSVTTAHAKWGDTRRSERLRDNQDRERVRDRIGLMKMWRLTEVLDLDQETASKLFPVMHEFDLKQKELGIKRGETIKRMKEALDKRTPDASVLHPLIEEFKKNERDMLDLRMQRLDSLSKILSDEQIVKMIALIPRFERDVRALLGEARAMRKHRRTPGERGYAPSERPYGPPMFE